jgi:hypothetical protein
MSKAVIKLKTVRRPSSQEIIGFRMQATLPNTAGRTMRARLENGEAVSFYATDEPAPSFKKPYLICESSDCSHIGKREIVRFLDGLRWQGFKEYEFFGNWDIADLPPHLVVQSMLNKAE